MQFEELAELIRTRRSIRKYKPADVPDEMLLKAIDLATWAPNGGNFQPWQYVVVKNKSVINQIADAFDERSRLMASWPEAEPFREHADRWIAKGSFFRYAPACIAVMVGHYQSVADRMLAARIAQNDPVAKEMYEWRRFGATRIQTIGGAIENLLLALHQQGLGACWMAGPQQCKGDVERILGIDTTQFDFVALVPVGWPDEEKTGGARKPLDQVVRFIR
ncbi:MAG: nitroreductase family protein [Mycobacterium leprae]